MLKGALLISLLLAPGVANAATVTWSGASGLTPDQISLPYTLGLSGSATAPTLSGGELTIATGAFGDNALYRHDAADLAFTGAHTISFRMRVDSGTTGSTGRAPAGVTFTTQGSTGQSLWIDTDEVFFIDAGGRSASSSIAAGYHDFRIDIAGTTAGSAVQLFVDNALLISDVLFSNAPNFGSAPRIGWGEISSAAQGQSTWTFFEHDAAVTVTPIPAALPLIGTALAALAFVGRRRRR